MLFHILAHRGKRRGISTVAITVQPQQRESRTVRQLPAGSRAFSTVSSNPSRSKCRESSPEKCSVSINQIIMGGATWISWILRNTLELTFRDQTKPRKYFPSLVVIILWGSFLHCKTAGEMQNQHCFYQFFLKKASSIGHCFCKMKKQLWLSPTCPTDQVKVFQSKPTLKISIFILI